MCDLNSVTDRAGCEEVWRRLMPEEFVSDLWEVRECFDRHYRRPPHFLVAQDQAGVRGLLPLSWIEESGCYGYFPGETWEGHTWLEQNRLPGAHEGLLRPLLDASPAPYQLRYLLPPEGLPESEWVVDEVGYLFLPPHYDYDLENYFQAFSRKSAKRVRREIAEVEAWGAAYRYDSLSDFDLLVRLNLDRFGDQSYFADPRFLASFRDLAHFLNDQGWLRFTTILLNDEVAAVDMGCVYRGTYTLVAGGTHGGYPGVAKLINLHHMRRACEERFERVDFLCGDFSWKKLFHLTPRPLYVLTNPPPEPMPCADAVAESSTCAQ